MTTWIGADKFGLMVRRVKRGRSGDWIAVCDECPDDSVCCLCGQTLPDDPQSGTWPFEGYCDAECCARDIVATRVKLINDDRAGSLRYVLDRALNEICRKARNIGGTST